MNKLMNLMDNFSQFTENVYKSVHNNGSERAERHQFEETEIKWTKGCGDIFRSHFWSIKKEKREKLSGIMTSLKENFSSFMLCYKVHNLGSFFCVCVREMFVKKSSSRWQIMVFRFNLNVHDFLSWLKMLEEIIDRTLWFPFFLYQLPRRHEWIIFKCFPY